MDNEITFTRPADRLDLHVENGCQHGSRSVPTVAVPVDGAVIFTEYQRVHRRLEQPEGRILVPVHLEQVAVWIQTQEELVPIAREQLPFALRAPLGRVGLVHVEHVRVGVRQIDEPFVHHGRSHSTTGDPRGPRQDDGLGGGGVQVVPVLLDDCRARILQIERPLFEETTLDLQRRSLHLVFELLAHQRVEDEAGVLLEVRHAVRRPVRDQLFEPSVGAEHLVPCLPRVRVATLLIEFIEPFCNAKVVLELGACRAILSTPLEFEHVVAAQGTVREALAEALAAVAGRSGRTSRSSRSSPGVAYRDRVVHVGVEVVHLRVAAAAAVDVHRVGEELVHLVCILCRQLQEKVRALSRIDDQQTTAVPEKLLNLRTQPGEPVSQPLARLPLEIQQIRQRDVHDCVVLDRPTAPAAPNARSARRCRMGETVHGPVDVHRVPDAGK